ncbi:type VII secretion protein EccB [Corynebacterium crudilactis]|uniref:Type VII secretion protein EccB n=1 Tax=Corynebacterium crudilactis TaxID=1652495 RepID=A0A172QRE6_9CORY|nr:type VII secretion protein EccB [Corynebacterium crudilactis]ANE03265.1 type VII secretion protein EccB [Corynebacterium crudilactis]
MAEGMLMPTTSAQVSGHKFLVRRIEHGLVMGDVRMIHDPLGRRRRALIFGVVACVMLAVGSVALAMFRPAMDPADASLIRAESGALFVRLDQAVHPVANVASARLIVGEPVEPVNASDAIIADMPRGVPVGLADAPGIFSLNNPDSEWFVCQDVGSGELHVLATSGEQQPTLLGEGKGWLGASKSESGEVSWHLITAEGRRVLPAAESPQGRIMRRHLRIDEDTPRLYLTTELLNTIPEREEIRFPDPLPELVDATPRSWLRTEGKLTEITPLQRGLLIDAGSVASPDATAPLGVHVEGNNTLALPSMAVEWHNLNGGFACADGQGKIGFLESIDSGVALSGDSRAVTFSTQAGGAVGVDSGFGYYVISEYGLMHPVSTGDTLLSLGITEVDQVPWSILRLLPQGSELSRETALTPAY